MTTSPEPAIVDVVRYPGGKNNAGTYQRIINLMPPHEVYIEPFLGSGAILRRKRPARLNIGIDLDADQLAKVSAEIVKSGEARAFRFIHTNALAYLAIYDFSGNELVYCDPPYLMRTRKGGALYRFEMSDGEHRTLLRLVRRLPCKVILSGYKSEMYLKALAGWNSIQFQALTRGGTMAEEWLWFNFPRPATLHDYQFLGGDFRARERIKRKIRRWQGKLAKMDDLERHALLCALSEPRSTIGADGDSCDRANANPR